MTAGTRVCLLQLLISTICLCQQSVYRLPTTIIPIHYNLFLEYQFTGPDIIGNVHILINISRAHIENAYNTNSTSLIQISLHMSENIDIVETHMNFTQINDSLTNIQSTNTNYNAQTEIAAFEYDISNEYLLQYMDTLPNAYILAHLYFQWGSIISQSASGIYLSEYEYNEETWIENAVTQFGLTDARKAFPCWDEPSFKSQFDIAIMGPANATILSNADIARTEYYSPIFSGCQYDYTWGHGSRCKEVTFEETPLMSTYILAMIVGEYESVTDINRNNVTTNVYAPIKYGKFGEFALTAALEVLPYFEDLFDYRYPLDKIDNIGLTRFSFGAMENWGLVTYRRGSLLANESDSSVQTLAGIATIVAHEFAHQWFGNVVTCDWWDDTWLNEGFATFFGVDAANIFYPDLCIYCSFLQSVNSRMESDASIYASQIIGNDIETRSDVLSQFGSLQYTKGGAVLRMLQYTMRNESFIGALQEYIETYAYKTAKSDDLFTILDAYFAGSGAMAEAYTTQAGVPAVFVDVINMSDTSFSVRIRQQRLTKEGPNFYSNDTDDYGYSNFSRYFDNDALIEQFRETIWPIHVKIVSAKYDIYDNESTEVIVTTKQAMIYDIERAMNENNQEFYLFNNEFKDYYRVIYDQTLLDMITANWGSLSFWNQFNIISDRYVVTKYNYATGVSYLNFIQDVTEFYNEYDIDYLSFMVWNTIINSLYDIDNRFCNIVNDKESKKELADFRRYAKKLLKPIYNAVNGYDFDNEYDGFDNSADVINLRSAVILALIRFNDNKVINEGFKKFNEFVIDGETVELDEFDEINVDKNLLESVITAAMAKLNGKTHELILSIYDESSNTQKGYIRSAFGNLYSKESLLMDTYDFIMDNATGITMSFSTQITALNNLKTCYGLDWIWDEMTKNTNDFQMLFDEGSNINTLTNLPNTFATRTRYDEIYNFYYGPNGGIRRNGNNGAAINQTLENIAMNTVWLNENEQDMSRYLKTKSSTSDLEDWEIALISVGSALCLIGLLLFVYCFIRRKKMNEQKKYTQMVGTDNYGATLK